MYIFNKFYCAITIYCSFTMLAFPFYSFSQESQIPMFNISGMIKLDVIYDINSPNGDRINYSSIPTGEVNKQQQVRIHARESRFKISTSRDVLGKTYRTFLEGDFYGGGSNSPTGSETISNASSFRLRHAYMSYGQWLVGQTWSNYVDLESFPETLDFSNDTGQAFIRQGQLRYSHNTDYLTFSYSIENPETDVYVADTMFQPSTSFEPRDPIFDFTAKAKRQSFWGHLSLQAVLRKHQIYTNLNNQTEIGYGFGTSGKIKISSHSLIRFHYSQGLGIGRYIQEAAGSAGIVIPSSKFENEVVSLQLLKAKGGYLSYQYAFRKALRINISSGFMDIIYPSDSHQYLIGDQTKKLTSYHANIIWPVIPTMDIGIEYSNAITNTVSGKHGNIKRLQLSTKVRF